MAKEIERKFLVDNDLWKRKGVIIPMQQAYLAYHSGNVVRVRIAADNAFLTIKGNLKGITRDEFEYQVPTDDALQMMKMAKGFSIVKKRYIEYVGGKKWEIDVFEKENEGLIVAEIELNSETESFEKPLWILDEVSNDPRYYNFNLAQNPFSNWH